MEFIPHLAVAFTCIEAEEAFGTHVDMEGEKRTTMNNLVNIIIVLLIVGWLIGFIGFGAMVGSLIHILLILAVVGIIYRLLSGGKSRA